MGYDDESETLDLCEIFERSEDEGLSQGAACTRGFHRLNLHNIHQNHATCMHCGELVYLNE